MLKFSSKESDVLGIKLQLSSLQNTKFGVNQYTRCPYDPEVEKLNSVVGVLGGEGLVEFGT